GVRQLCHIPRSSRSKQRNGTSIASGGIASCCFCRAATASSPRAADDDADLLDPVWLDPRASPFVHPSRRGSVPFLPLRRLCDFDCMVGAHYRGTIRTPRDNRIGGFTTADH